MKRSATYRYLRLGVVKKDSSCIFVKGLYARFLQLFQRKFENGKCSIP